MMFKNSTKLLIANFAIVWKLILYYIIVFGITIGLIAPFFTEIGQAFNGSGLLDKIGTLLTNFNVSVNPFDLVLNLNDAFTSIFSLLLGFLKSNTAVALYVCFVILYVFPFLLSLADLPVGQVLFGYMSSLTKYSFTGSYLKYFARSVRYQLLKQLILLPFNILIVLAFVYTLRLVTLASWVVYIMPLLLVSIVVILSALKKTIFSGWSPAIVVYDCNMFKGFKKGVKAVSRRFLKVFSTALMIMLISIAVTYLFGTFVFPIIFPFFASFFYVFEMVMFYGSQGMRYYVDLDTILSPKRLEENDSFKKVKYLI
ncbi:MAG: hypothetical protein ACI4L1_02675 [Christensenellales bacterium]